METIVCDFCGQSEKLGDAIEAGWEPTYFMGACASDCDTCRPLCPQCAATYCKVIEGEVVLTPEGAASLLVDHGSKFGEAFCGELEVIACSSEK